MKTYDVFLDYYEKIVRGINSPLEEEVEFLTEKIRENTDKNTILELACGTGEVAAELVKNGFNVTGLDISENMLERAKINLPDDKLILGDMTDFDLKQQFSTILCNYNSICHLLEWSQWQNCFEMTHKHLEEDGIFIFDINTTFEFESITKDFKSFYTFGDDSVCLEMSKKDGIYEWLINIFKKSPDGRYDLIQEVVQENSFPIKIIKKELKNKGFRVLDVIDYHYGDVSDESERVYFICKKK